MVLKKHLNLIIPIFIVVLLIIFGFAYNNKVIAQEQSVKDLETRLKQFGIPLIDIETSSKIPFEVKILIQSESEKSNVLPEDIWNMSVARRQAELAYRIGIELDRYTLCLINKFGKEIVCEQSFLYASDRNQDLPVYNTGLDKEETKVALEKLLDFGNFEIKHFEVQATPENDVNGYILYIEVADKNTEEVNKSLPDLLESIFFVEWQGSDKYDIQLIMIHLKVLDENGKVLLDYVRDIESGTSNWTMQPGVYDEWFPKPERDFDGPTQKPTQVIPTYTYPAPERENDSSADSAYPASESTQDGEAYP